MTDTTTTQTSANITPRHKSRMKQLWEQNKYPYLFLLPWIAGLCLFTLYPIIASFRLSFTDHDLFRTPNFIGLQNYINMFTDDARFLKAISVTFRFVFLGVPLQLLTALVLALVLNKGIPGLPVFRAAFYVPSLLGGSVAISVLWRQLFGAQGIFNQVISVLGLMDMNNPISWVSNPNYSLYTLIVLHMWQFGSPMIIFIAGLKQIPTELYESAQIDGATKRAQFMHITLPMLTPILFFNLVMQIVSAFQSFTPAFIVGGGRGGGPLDSILFYSLYLYFLAFSEFRMGYASALAWVLLIIIGIFTGLLFLNSKKWVHYEN